MTTDPHEIERLRRAFAALGEESEPAGEGPDPELIWAAVRGELPPSEVSEIVDRLAESPAWAEAWRLARELQEQAPSEAGTVVETRERRTGRRKVWPRILHPAWTAAGLAAAMVIALTAWWTVWRPFTEPAFRGAPEAIRSLVPEAEALPPSDLRLAWSGPPGAVYDLYLTRQDLEPILTVTGLTEPRYRVPETALGELPQGTILVWRVEARLPDHRRISSPAFLLRVGRSPLFE